MKKSILFVVLVLSVFLSVAQKIKTNEIVVNTDSMHLKVNTTTVPVEVKVKEGMVYYWFKANAIHSSVGGYDGKLLHGKFTSFYQSNDIKEKGEYNKGLKNGEWKMWLENGKLISIANYKKGGLNGLQQTFDSTGQETLRANYKNNLLHGAVITYENGKETAKTKYKKGIALEEKQSKQKESNENDSEKKAEEENLEKKVEDAIQEKDSDKQPK